MQNLRILTVLMLAGVFVGCGDVTRNPLPADLVGVAQPIGIANVRDWGGRFSQLFQDDMVESIRQSLRENPNGWADKDGYVNILAISGGGPDGAFGSGLLAGWTANGTRPTFKLVTGVSTGALIAPFAFLGSEYDDVLKKFYTTTSTKDVVRERPILEALSSDSLTDSSPLARLIHQTIDDKIFAAIAAEHNKGRRLFVCTTNLDARRPVVWNMGAIAASGKPGSRELFCRVLRASASIPVAMGPMYLPVEANGKRYDELHVDGGVTTEVFFYALLLDLPAAIKEVGIKRQLKAKLHVIMNNQIGVAYEQVKPGLMSIGSRAISSLIMTQGIGDLYRIYTITQRDGIEFNLISVPKDFKYEAKEMFDPADMTRLYDVAYKAALNGIKWEKKPPGL